MEIRIKKNEYFDEYGSAKGEYYHIEYKITFLFFWEIWRTVKHRESGWSDSYKSKTRFSTIEDAEEFAEEHLCKGKPYDTWETTTVKTLTCKSE